MTRLKTSAAFLFLGLALPFLAAAQDVYRGALRIRSVDGTSLAVSIDGRRYDRVGRRLLIGDLPTGRHRLRVYAVYPNRNDGGAAGETVYRGVFYAEPGTLTECVVDAGAGTARMRTLDATPRYSGEREGAGAGPRSPQSTDAGVYEEGSGFRPSDLEDLRRRVADRITDGDKLQTLKTALDRRTVRSADVRTMLGWLSFDSSRLEFAKWAYAHVSDRDNYWKLEDAFSFDSTKTEFNTYVRTAR